jgi:VWFA-related protein
MRKPATSLLAISLLVLFSSCSLWAQQTSAPTSPIPTTSTPQSSTQQTTTSQTSTPPTSTPKDSAQQNPVHTDRQSEPTTTLRVDVNLVNVFVTVTDAHGAPIGGLTKENFVLMEDEQPQKISVFDKESALPLSIGLAIDTSLTTHHDLPLEQASAKRFAHAIVRPIDGLSVYGFNEDVHEFTHGYISDLKRIDESIDHIRPGAATALFDAIYLVSRALDRRKGRKVIVLITDGGDTWSKISYQDAVRAAEEAEAIVYSIIVVPIEMPSAKSATNCARSICWLIILRSVHRSRSFAASR